MFCSIGRPWNLQNIFIKLSCNGCIAFDLPVSYAYINLHNHTAYLNCFDFQGKEKHCITDEEHFTWETSKYTCNVPPPPVVSQSSDTLTTVHGSDAFQWKSTTLSLYQNQKFEEVMTSNQTKSEGCIIFNLETYIR